MTDNEFVYLEYPFKYIGSEPLPVTQTYVLGDFDWEVLET
jgi:hypothetical protein